MTATGATHYTFTDTTATNGQTYFYVVQAWYSDGTGSGSTNSSTQSISTPQNAVTNLDAALDVDGVHVSWLGVDANATSVEVTRSGTDGAFASTVTLDPSATEYIDSDALTPGGTEFYTVTVIGPGGHTDSAPVEYDVPE